MPGVRRISLIGSLTTDKPLPKDKDLLVSIDEAVDFDGLVLLGRHLKGTMQSINLGVDIFLADESGRYIGRVCGFRECHLRQACYAMNCGRRQHLNDDLDNVALDPAFVAEPPIDLHPKNRGALHGPKRCPVSSAEASGGGAP
ncbi:hypothetical protein BH11PSE3_BH11PSE3_01630 [soil metagenome]